jgi:flavin reductase (DIM6/NTAB) family NADH-FMN oxidoreductase RutF
MYLNKNGIHQLERRKRLNLVNSLTGIKPANLIGTRSLAGEPNLAIFSSVVHLGSDPGLLGFILRPDAEVRRHTYENIKESGFYTINHVHRSFIENAHYTSAKFEKDVSEFKMCRLTEEYLHDFQAPYVQESKLKMGLKFIEELHIAANDTTLIVGEIQHLYIPEEIMDDKGGCDLSLLDDVGISGLNTYYALEKIAWFPYARPNELPSFHQEN